MKKLILLVVLCSLLVACAPIEKYGLSEYSPSTSSVEITRQLFPEESFLTTFAYESGDYLYYSAEDFLWGYETVMAYITYEDSMYEQAKAFCLERYKFCDNHQYECCNRVFSHIVKHEERSNCSYPEIFNMFAFDDQKHSLYFIGYWNGNPNDSERIKASENFSQFVQEVFPDLYAMLVSD